MKEFLTLVLVSNITVQWRNNECAGLASHQSLLLQSFALIGTSSGVEVDCSYATSYELGPGAEFQILREEGKLVYGARDSE